MKIYHLPFGVLIVIWSRWWIGITLRNKEMRKTLVGFRLGKLPNSGWVSIRINRVD